MQTLPITSVQIVIALVLTVFGSAIQGSIGIGYAVVVAPILMLYAPEFVPGPLVVAALFLVVLMALRERRHVVVGDLGVATLGRALGTVPGALVISLLPKTFYELVFGSLVSLGVIVSILGWHVRPTRLNVFFASTLSGFMSTVSSVGGPPMALVYQHEEGPRIRATISAIFMIGGLITIAGLWWANRFHVIELLLGIMLMPGVLVGFLISRYTTSRIDAEHIRPALLAGSAVCAVVVIIRALAAQL